MIILNWFIREKCSMPEQYESLTERGLEYQQVACSPRTASGVHAQAHGKRQTNPRQKTGNSNRCVQGTLQSPSGNRGN